MNFIKNILLRKRTLGGWILIITSCVLLISSILYVAIPGGELKISDYSTTLAFIMILIGSLVGLSTLFIKNKYYEEIAPIVTLIFVSIGMARQMYLAVYPITDVITNVNWFGGNLAVYLTFFIIFLLGTIALIACCFMKIHKDEEKQIEEIK